MNNPTVVYWDSCVFIELLQANRPDRYETVRAIAGDAQRGHVKIVTSALTLAEVVTLSGLSLEDAKKEQLIADFFENDYIFVRNVDPAIAECARRIIRAHGFKPPDAIQAATAILNRVQVLHTYDGTKMLKKDGLIPFTLAEPSSTLKIQEPSWSYQSEWLAK